MKNVFDHDFRFAGFFPLTSEINAIKTKLQEQFEAVLLPQSSVWMEN